MREANVRIMVGTLARRGARNVGDRPRIGLIVPAGLVDPCHGDMHRPPPRCPHRGSPAGSFKPASRRKDRSSALDPRVAPILEALVQGRRAIVQSAEPAEALVRSVWSRLPGRSRRRTSVATWAFGDANRFDLLASPRLGGLSLDGSELVLPFDPSQPRP